MYRMETNYSDVGLHLRSVLFITTCRRKNVDNITSEYRDIFSSKKKLSLHKHRHFDYIPQVWKRKSRDADKIIM